MKTLECRNMYCKLKYVLIYLKLLTDFVILKSFGNLSVILEYIMFAKRKYYTCKKILLYLEQNSIILSMLVLHFKGITTFRNTTSVIVRQYYIYGDSLITIKTSLLSAT